MNQPAPDYKPIQRPQIEQKALQFALIRHGSEKRDYTKQEPYMAHCIKSAQFLIMFNHPTEAVQAALLQGVLDRTETSIQELSSEFGPIVSSMVWDMTPRKPVPGCTPTTTRKMEIDRFGHATSNVQSIKAASLIDDAWHVFMAHQKVSDQRSALLWPWFFKDMKAYGEVMTLAHPALRNLLHTISSEVIMHHRWPDPKQVFLRNQGLH